MGIPDAVELDLKARLAASINRIVQRRGLTQAQVALALKINQPKVSALLCYKLEGFSVERLMRFLVALGQNVEIVVKSQAAYPFCALPSAPPDPAWVPFMKQPHRLHAWAGHKSHFSPWHPNPRQN